MLYLVSDIHGNLKDFQELLCKIDFSGDRDHMIILGDLFDREPDGIPLLKYIAPYIRDGSMQLLMGNHELFAQMYLKSELSERKWIAFGGRETLRDIQKLSTDERAELLEFLENLPYYQEINLDYLGRVLVTHTGIDCDHYVWNPDGTINVKQSIERAVACNRYRYMIGMDLHQIPEAEKKKLDTYMIVGHVPVFRLNETMTNTFYRTRYYMDIDSGSGFREQGGVLGCYCVTTDEEIYVRS